LHCADIILFVSAFAIKHFTFIRVFEFLLPFQGASAYAGDDLHTFFMMIVMMMIHSRRRGFFAIRVSLLEDYTVNMLQPIRDAGRR
jgi:hypothetical protein